MQEFNRIEKLLQDDYDKIKNLSVLVLGLGGVGGYVVESLVRLGIKKIVLVDYDIVDITNINRQIIANHETIGKYKVDVFEDRIKTISPTCEIVKIKEKITPDTIQLLFQEKVDFYVDACDTKEVKCEFLKRCLTEKYPFIMSMGTANKLDATLLEITDLSKTCYDPLAKYLRKYVKEHHLKGKVPVISSKEEVKKCDGLGSVSYVPSVAGLLITNYIVQEVLKW